MLMIQFHEISLNLKNLKYSFNYTLLNLMQNNKKAKRTKLTRE